MSFSKSYGLLAMIFNNSMVHFCFFRKMDTGVYKLNGD
jgi:hypothetical protein